MVFPSISQHIPRIFLPQGSMLAIIWDAEASTDGDLSWGKQWIDGDPQVVGNNPKEKPNISGVWMMIIYPDRFRY